MPTRSRRPSPVSTVEWMPSESIAELPVAAAPTNFITAMARLAPMAPKTASRESANRISEAARVGAASAVDAGRAARERRAGSGGGRCRARRQRLRAGGAARERLGPRGGARGGGSRLQLSAVGPRVRWHGRAELLRVAGGRRAGVDASG